MDGRLQCENYLRTTTGLGESHTLGADPVVAHIVNTYTKDVGTFRITKVLNNDAPASAAQKDFQFTVVCTKDGATVLNQPVTITGAGQSAPIETLVGAECAVTEDVASAAITGYDLVVSNSGGMFTQARTEGAVVITNTYAKKVGDYVITKQVVDPDNVAAGKTFNFSYTCTNNDVELTDKEKSGTFSLAAGESITIADLPAGTTCVVTELAADVDGASLVTSGVEEVTIVAGQEVNTSVVNTYAAWRGDVALTKEVVGPGMQGHAFTVNYTCTLGGDRKEGSVNLTGGETVTVAGLRSGATCTFAEDTTFATPAGIAFNQADSATTATVTVGANGSVTTAALRNVFTQDVAVTLRKVVTGLPEALGVVNGQDFQVEASWVDAAGQVQTHMLKVTDGQAVTLPAVPAGTVVTLKEILPANTAVVQWGTPSYTAVDAGVVVDNGDGTAKVTIPAAATEIILTNASQPTLIWTMLSVVPAALLPGVINALTSGLATVPGTPWAPAVPGTPGQPGVPGGSGGSSANGSSGSGNQQPAPGTTNDGQGNAPARATNNQQAAPASTARGAGTTDSASASPAAKGKLAATGASVAWMILVALILGVLGVLFVRRSKR